MNLTQRSLCIAGAAFTIINLTACKTTEPATFPPRADLVAATEAKPKPSAAILTDPAANDRYNSALEAWADRLHSAGVRLCGFYRGLGMDVECGK